VRILLDTHVWVWSQEKPEEMGERSRALLLDAGNDLFVSSISVLEIARMVASGRLMFAKELRRWVADGAESLGFEEFAVDSEVAIEAYNLTEPFHRDPADRVLVATARVHDCLILSADRLILDYAYVRSVDART
jgi:PIN domain nuclease of toxin-antitoxin system